MTTHAFRSALATLLVLAALAVPAAAQDRIVPQSQEQIRLSYAPIVARAAPAVVNVHTSRHVERRSHPFFDDPFFRRFFGDQMPGQGRGRVQNSLGSGVIVDPSGLIVTNAHVIEGADEIRVALSDRREFSADLVTTDKDTDLAVLRIETEAPLPFLDFANSDLLQVGDIVLAIGNPFGVGQTVTSGIVSALARTQVGISDYGFFIQTDAAINPGNSGGALIDMEGRLVGVNTAIYSRSGGSLGIGFAIPANMVRLVVASASSGGEIRRPWFGASLQTVTPDIAESLGMDRPTGVLVANVHPDGPAAEAGLATGDIVTAVDGREVGDPNAFRYRFATKGVGGETTLTVLRKGRVVSVDVALIAAPEEPPRDERVIGGPSPFAGATVVNLSPAVIEEMSLDGAPEGVAIAEIEPGSPAHRVGFRPGDIIREVNGVPVETTGALAEATDNVRRAWRLVIERGGRTIQTILRS